MSRGEVHEMRNRMSENDAIKKMNIQIEGEGKERNHHMKFSPFP